jgi:hypothetical protein
MPVTVNLPDVTYHQLQRVAQMTKRRLEDVLLQTIEGNMPPVVDDASLDIQAELQTLQWLDSKALWTVARGKLTPEQQARQEYLLHQNQRGTITPEEVDEMNHLGEKADKLTVKKAYAYALLRWRGFPLPTLEAMESRS